MNTESILQNKMDEKRINQIRQILFEWYCQNKRELPWRETKDPYKIWISEVILQQTRVNQGFDYYLRFIERFPTVKSLAESDEQEVLRYWQGLGYYSRARNLHKASRIINTNFKGVFPITYKDIISLPGIGEYTASAIVSFAYNLPYAAVDGNIFRVLSRLTADESPIDTAVGKKKFIKLAEELLERKNPGLHNQAIMEFGALQCTPKQPDCMNCPLSQHCEAYKLNVVLQLPVKQSKIKVTERFFNYLFIINGEFTYLQKRTKKDIWQNLFEFPLIETTKKISLDKLAEQDSFLQLFEGIELNINTRSIQKRHILSHQIIYAVFYTINIEAENSFLKKYVKVLIDEINNYPVSRLTDLFLESEIQLNI